jgi:hypothetical protein
MVPRVGAPVGGLAAWKSLGWLAVWGRPVDYLCLASDAVPVRATVTLVVSAALWLRLPQRARPDR